MESGEFLYCILRVVSCVAIVPEAHGWVLAYIINIIFAFSPNS